MKKISYKKIFAVAAIVSVFLPIAAFAQNSPSPPTAPTPPIVSLPLPPATGAPITPTTVTPPPTSSQSAATPNNPNNSLDCKGSLATCAVYFVAYFINKLLGVFVGLGASITVGVLGLNLTQLQSSPLILAGFSISLSLANLGFILLIIIIAIATILRVQNYNIKKLLWKLVAMAILINFGLVIAMPIISFSDGLSLYFVNSIGKGGDLSTQLTTAFSPEKFTSSAITNGIPVDDSKWSTANYVATGVVGVAWAGWGYAGGAAVCAAGGVTIIAAPACGFIGAAIGGVLGAYVGHGAGSLYDLIKNGNFNDAFVSMIIGQVTAAAILAIIALTMIAFGVMLLVRYVYLTILLVVLPLAWLCWAFPGLGGHFQKWWRLFLRWTFFPVIALFFVYLALLVVMGQQAIVPKDTSISLSAQTLNNIALAAMMLGGLYAANALGIAGADIAMGYAKAGGKWVGAYAGKQGKKTARLGYQKMGGERFNKVLQEGNILGVPIRKIPLLGRGASLLGRGIASVSTNEKLVDDAKKNVPKDPKQTKQRLAGSMNKQDQFAHIAALVASGDLTGDEMINGQNIKDFMDSNENTVRRYGQGKLSKDVDKALFSNKEMRDAAKVGNQEKLGEAGKKFRANFSRGDASKSVNVDTVFADPNSLLAQSQWRGVELERPDLMSTIFAKAKGTTMENISKMHEGVKLESETAAKTEEAKLKAQKESIIQNEESKMTNEHNNATEAIRNKNSDKDNESNQLLSKIAHEIEGLKKEHDITNKEIGPDGLPTIGSTRKLEAIGERQIGLEKQRAEIQSSIDQRRDSLDKAAADGLRGIKEKITIMRDKLYGDAAREARINVGVDHYDRTLANSILNYVPGPTSPEAAPSTPPPPPSPGGGNK